MLLQHETTIIRRQIYLSDNCPVNFKPTPTEADTEPDEWLVTGAEKVVVESKLPPLAATFGKCYKYTIVKF